jgi:hypothetical protein
MLLEFRKAIKSLLSTKQKKRIFRVFNGTNKPVEIVTKFNNINRPQLINDNGASNKPVNDFWKK